MFCAGKGTNCRARSVAPRRHVHEVGSDSAAEQAVGALVRPRKISIREDDAVETVVRMIAEMAPGLEEQNGILTNRLIPFAGPARGNRQISGIGGRDRRLIGEHRAFGTVRVDQAAARTVGARQSQRPFSCANQCALEGTGMASLIDLLVRLSSTKWKPGPLPGVTSVKYCAVKATCGQAATEGPELRRPALAVTQSRSGRKRNWKEKLQERGKRVTRLRVT
jgi:hypothetical protein